MNGTDYVEPEALVRYLSDLARLRTTPITDLANYHSVLWLNDVPEHPKVRSSLAGQLVDQAAWLVIDRVKLPVCPELDADLVPWLAGVDLDRPHRAPAIH